MSRGEIVDRVVICTADVNFGAAQHGIASRSRKVSENAARAAALERGYADPTLRP